jgi:two-component system, OmpR family, phosphate regulon sensor histidine kinase PhoR
MITEQLVGKENLLLIFEKLIRGVSDSVIITRADDIEAPCGPTIIYVNEACCSMTGYTKEELVGQTPRIFQGPETSRTKLDIIKDALAKKKKVRIDLLNYKKSGEAFLIDMEIIPVKAGDSTSSYFIAIQRDITELGKSQQTIQTNAELYLRLFEGSPDCVKLLDADGYLEHMNSNGCVLMEVDDFDGMLRHMAWSDLWPEETKPVVSKSVADAKCGNKSRFQAFCPTAKGAPKWWDVSVNPVLDEHNKVVQIISSSRDITNIKLEEQRKSDFLKIVAHELKTPLTAIKGYAHLLTEELGPLYNENADVAFALTRIDNQVDRLTKFINEILDLTRLETDKMFLDKEYTSLHDLVENTVLDLRVSYPAAIIKIEQLDECFAFVDKDKIEQVVINLVTNAIKFSKAKSTVEIYLSQQPDNLIHLQVKDYGCGISPEEHDKIFDLFYQVKECQKLSKGFGMGLYLIKNIVSLHGGKISIVSEKEKGSTFTVELPTTN